MKNRFAKSRRSHMLLRGLVLPAEFIPMAEETGLIIPLGQWALATACEQLAAWSKSPPVAGLNMAVNVSVRQFRHPEFTTQLLDLLRISGARSRENTATVAAAIPSASASSTALWVSQGREKNS